MQRRRANFFSWFKEKITEGITPDQWNHIKFGYYMVFTARSKMLTRLPLGSLRAIHLLEHAIAREKLAERIQSLASSRERILTQGCLDGALLQELMPSPSQLMVVKNSDGLYYSFNGNSRIHALNAAFPDRPDLQVEVQVFEPRSPKAIPWLNRVRHSYDVSQKRMP